MVEKLDILANDGGCFQVIVGSGPENAIYEHEKGIHLVVIKLYMVFNNLCTCVRANAPLVYRLPERSHL
jgi:hypothetical protein